MPKPGTYLTRDELAEINGQITMGDVWRAREAGSDEERGAMILWHVATRIGMHSGGMQEFLDRVLEADFAAVRQAAAAGQISEAK